METASSIRRGHPFGRQIWAICGERLRKGYESVHRCQLLMGRTNGGRGLVHVPLSSRPSLAATRLRPWPNARRFWKCPLRIVRSRREASGARCKIPSAASRDTAQSPVDRSSSSVNQSRRRRKARVLTQSGAIIRRANSAPMRQSSLNVYLAWLGQSPAARGSLLVWRARCDD